MTSNNWIVTDGEFLRCDCRMNIRSLGLFFLRSRFALTPVKLRSKSCTLEPFTIRRSTNAVTLIFRGIQISFYISSYCASLSLNYAPRGRRSVGRSIEDSPPVLSFRFADNLFRNPLKWMSQCFPFVLQNVTLRVHFWQFLDFALYCHRNVTVNLEGDKRKLTNLLTFKITTQWVSLVQ